MVAKVGHYFFPLMGTFKFLLQFVIIRKKYPVFFLFSFSIENEKAEHFYDYEQKQKNSDYIY